MCSVKSLMWALAGAAVLACTPGLATAQEFPNVTITQPGESDVTQSVVLLLDKSTVVDFGRPASDVFITNPEIADAAVQTDTRIIFRGVEVGQTNAFVFDRNGNQMLNLEIRVEPDTAGLEELVSRHVPQARIKVEGVNSNVILTGLVDNLSQSDAVMRIARAYLGLENDRDAENGIVNMMSIAAKDQVLLQVRIVEMQRSVIKQLGINLNGNAQTTSFGPASLPTTPGGPPGIPDPRGFVEAATAQSFNVAGVALGGLATNVAFNGSQGSISASLQALERIGVVRTLAEPNITALSGEPAQFLAGGEFPVPVAQGDDGSISVDFRSFGVGLGFTPIVLSEGRISLRMSTEVSELSVLGSFQGQPSFGVGPDGGIVAIPGLSIPALTVRRAETTIELPSGQSMMIAGLIEASTRQTIDDVPGIKNIPVLGALFRSRDFINEESELVIIVTPYLVDPAAPSELRTPDEGFANASDAKTVFFGKLNRLYGKGEKPPESFDNYVAPVGFIQE